MGVVNPEVHMPHSECEICNKMVSYNDLATECTEKCRFWLLEATVETTVSLHCAMKNEVDL